MKSRRDARRARNRAIEAIKLGLRVSAACAAAVACIRQSRRAARDAACAAMASGPRNALTAALGEAIDEARALTSSEISLQSSGKRNRRRQLKLSRPRSSAARGWRAARKCRFSLSGGLFAASNAAFSENLIFNKLNKIAGDMSRP